MTQENFEKMRILNEAIIGLEETLAKVDHAHMEMCRSGLCEPYQDYKDEVNAAYYALIPKEERDRLTALMGEQLKTAIQKRIDELKSEFEKL